MATITKLTPKEIEKLKSLKIEGLKDVESARKKLIKFLGDNEVEGVEDDSLKELMEMAELFIDEDEDDEDSTDDSADEDEDEEDPEEAPKPSSKKSSVSTKSSKKEPDDEDDEEDEEDGEDDEDEEEDEEDEKPAKKSVAKVVNKNTNKKPSVSKKKDEEDEDEDEQDNDALVDEVKKKGIVTKVSDKSKTATAKATPKKPAVAGAAEKFDGRNNEEHMVYLDPFREIFDPAKFQIDTLKQGFTVRTLGSNSKLTVMNFDSLKIVDGKLFGDFYNNRFKDVEDLLKFLPEDFEEDHEVGMFRGESHPCIRKVGQDEVIELLNENLLPEMLKRAGVTDTKMGQNRKKFEESLAKTQPATAKKKK